MIQRFDIEYQSWPFKACDRVRAPPHAPCFVKVHDKHAPRKILTYYMHLEIELFVRKEELFCFLFLNNLIK